MSDIRESHIILDTENFKKEECNTKFSFKLNLGTKEHEEKLSKIKAFGVEPATNVLVICNEFETEEAAQAAAKVVEMYESEIPKHYPGPPFWETPKVQGKTLVAPFRVPEQYAAQLVILEPFITALGELAATDQYLEVEAALHMPGKEIFSGEGAAPDAKVKVNSMLKVALVTHKDLPKKISEIMKEMMGEGNAKTNIAMTYLSNLKHVRVNARFEDYISGDKEDIKNRIKTVSYTHLTLPTICSV
eukprot:TRINITY_DN3107_c0_g1_i7.p1 TRINITY_DN3107_c0_g1~~TRINITY_DN3107_c0_g1_i7.p1  ORF type:complete len:246 (-),score=91.78 TRINITY_DN3107_c0_g1_i7:47-784(-)